MFITLDLCGFFTNGTSPSPLSDFVDFCFGRTCVAQSKTPQNTYIIVIRAIEGLVDGLDCLVDLFPSNSHFGHSDKLEFLEDLDSGKFGRGKVWRIDSVRAFGEIIDQPIDYLL